MASIGVEICLIISILSVMHMASKNYDKVDIQYWTGVVTIPIIIAGYWLRTRVKSPEAAEVVICFIYLSTILMLVVTFITSLKSVGMNITSWMKMIFYLLTIGHCILVWQFFGSGHYFGTIEVKATELGSVIKIHYGDWTWLTTIYPAIMFLVVIGTLIWAYIKKGTFSGKLLLNYLVIVIIGIILSALEYIFNLNHPPLPYLYAVSSVIIAIDYDYMRVHDVQGLVSIQNKGNNSSRGYVVIDYNGNFLSCNKKTFDFIPWLKNQHMDKQLPESETLFAEMIANYKESGETFKKFNAGEVTCICELSEFTMRRDDRKQGYLFEMRDATDEQKVLDVMEEYNATLNAEVEAKTRDIANIKDKVVMGMANVIENRAENVGGHVRRTSDLMRILMDDIIKDNLLDVDQEFATDIVRATSMHDMGKITIDYRILHKPSKLSKEEYEIMKTHAEKSGEMVKLMLDGVEEEHFVDVAYNVARYHHERWDGKGYPEGLVGSMIPLEARIMAIVDVYDALVSERIYKEAMSFEKAKDTMLGGMGTQFDPNLKKAFLCSLDKMENYYKNAH